MTLPQGQLPFPLVVQTGHGCLGHISIATARLHVSIIETAAAKGACMQYNMVTVIPFALLLRFDYYYTPFSWQKKHVYIIQQTSVCPDFGSAKVSHNITQHLTRADQRILL